MKLIVVPCCVANYYRVGTTVQYIGVRKIGISFRILAQDGSEVAQCRQWSTWRMGRTRSFSCSRIKVWYRYLVGIIQMLRGVCPFLVGSWL